MGPTSKINQKNEKDDDDDEIDEIIEEHDDENLEEEQEDLYKALGLSSSATTADIKSAYKKLALKYHPDKQTGKSEEQVKENIAHFQTLHSYYEYLMDPKTREIYDRTGRFDPASAASLERDEDVSWAEYFEALLTRVTPDLIDEYEKVYKYSEQERQDVLQAYTKTKGTLLDMIDHVPLSTLDDMERFRGICESAIQEGEMERYKKFGVVNQRELKRKREELLRERGHVEDTEGGRKKKKEGEAGLDSLKQLIMQGHADRINSLADRLEEKYAKPKSATKKTSSKKKAASKGPELNDADFEAYQAKIFSKTSTKK